MTDEAGQQSSQTGSPPAPPPSPPTVGAPASGGGHHGYGGGAATAGIILILVGVLLLVGRVTEQVSIWQLWPLFVLVPGLVQCVTPGSEGWSVHRFFDGLVTVAIGAILLGNTTGVISWGVWWRALQLWPVLLISAGLGILGKAIGQTWIRVAGTLVVLAALGFAVSTSFAGMPVTVLPPASGASVSYAEDIRTPQARLNLKSGVGEIDIDSTRERAIEIDATSPFGEPRFTSERDGSRSVYDFALTDEGSIQVFPSTPTSRVEATLSEQPLWEIAVDSGVATLDADLSELRVSEFTLKTGVSSNTVRLGDAPRGVSEGRVNIESGVASVKVLVPKDAQVSIDSASGLTGIDVSSIIGKRGANEWRTDGFDAARSAGRPVWVITSKSGLGSLEIDTY